MMFSSSSELLMNSTDTGISFTIHTDETLGLCTRTRSCTFRLYQNLIIFSGIWFKHELACVFKSFLIHIPKILENTKQLWT